jgi:magnesium transporter
LIADPNAPRPTITVLRYHGDEFKEQDVRSVDELRPFLDEPGVIWVNVDGLGDVGAISRMGEIFGLHELALEDVLNTHQRPKIEAYDKQIFLVARMTVTERPAETEQLSLFLCDRVVLTFQEGIPGDPFEPVRDRIRKGGPIRQFGADYLTYALLDATVDGYFPVLESLGDTLETLEDDVLYRPSGLTIPALHEVKSGLLALRRALWPLREVMNSLVRDPHARLSDETRLHLRDCYDHVVRLIDLVETYRELCSDLTDLYLSSLSQRLNQVMKILTIISTIFIPLTFITSIYGMNFDAAASPWNMPETHAYWGYPTILAIMAAIGVGLLVWFWRAGWLSSGVPGRVRPLTRRPDDAR